MSEAAVDLVLAAAVVGVAWRALTVRGHFAAVVLYIAFGLLLSLIWVRLAAPDLALAEAAIGAGITGALLLDTVAAIGRRRGGTAAAPGGAPRPDEGGAG